MENKKLPWLIASSIDPTRISSMIKGLAVLIPSLIIVTNAFGIATDAGEVNDLLDSSVKLIAAIASAYGAVWATWGVVRKILVRTGVYKVE